jgi:hypothetical protein
VLVSAVFEAFVTVVRRKCERLFRIAAIDPQSVGQAALSDALVKAIAEQASEVAAQFLNISIRAVDYCPPADMEFGEYLRALITADGDLERTDKWGCREAIMRSFRRRDIVPDHVQFLTEDAMRWQSPAQDLRIPELAFQPAPLRRGARAAGRRRGARSAGAGARPVRDRPGRTPSASG